MTKRLEVYKCEACGNIVEVLRPGPGALICCNHPMRLMIENTIDASKEKHVPVIEHTAGGIKVTVGGVPHPMEEKHFIEWIALCVNGRVLRQFLKPGDAPTAFFPGVTAATVMAREYCNLHGLWKA